MRYISLLRNPPILITTSERTKDFHSRKRIGERRRKKISLQEFCNKSPFPPPEPVDFHSNENSQRIFIYVNIEGLGDNRFLTVSDRIEIHFPFSIPANDLGGKGELEIIIFLFLLGQSRVNPLSGVEVNLWKIFEGCKLCRKGLDVGNNDTFERQQNSGFFSRPFTRPHRREIVWQRVLENIGRVKDYITIWLAQQSERDSPRGHFQEEKVSPVLFVRN
ncbi:hypothetical protein CDAR_233191 [Caerostris darwini]|uniref:Uncharacterized protein n=1 Tax=Caerostris darwini TaxID=1538125 RepID=A0AAV4V4T3_9ARAC|nr:hypothetical protein CDAR_233191 [Caerostris darwini]